VKAFSVPFSIENGTISFTNDYDKIVRDQVIDAVTTNQGERIMHPDWGCDIQSVLFDPSDELERKDTASYVKERLVNFVPKAFINHVNVNVADSKPNTVYVDISYKSSSYSPTTSVMVGLDIATTASGNLK
jgi:hypothetical protein